jgi:pimeloyl-[acyl-carrier protein] methyl ester esterase
MTKLVFIHGWALNSGIWGSFLERLEVLEPEHRFEIQCLDLPGYGSSLGVECSSCIESMAGYCLQQAPEPAIWIGWSLGGLVAMQAALLAPAVVQGMQLICTSPKFVGACDWSEGVDLDAFSTFSKSLASNYERTLTVFLLMQASSAANSRELARAAQQAVCAMPSPSAQTLDAGIECLATTDLRAQLHRLLMPVQVVSGLRDRVANPASSNRLAQILNAELIELDTGHAPFMTSPDDVALNLIKLANRVNDDY